MKNKVMRIVAMLSLVLAFSAITAFAQVRVERLKVSLDFDFTAGDKQLPAGHYLINFLNNDQAHRLIVIQNAETGEQAIVGIIPTQQTGQSLGGQLVFSQYGDQRFLSSVQLGDETYRQDLLKSRAERQLARNSSTGQNTAQVKTVVVRIAGKKA
ncbi:MAG TPA: hypothetical protein VFD58_32400 [Blastocatellia bacterium]|nr:hypothetical protein [Blastocatellia bacterium]